MDTPLEKLERSWRMGHATKRQIRDANAILKPIGVTLKATGYDGELRVNLIGGREATAYYTDDLNDAVQTGVVMSKHPVPQPDHTSDCESWAHGECDCQLGKDTR